MPLKKSVGNMYPWVTHTHCHLGGECPHKCSYCYVNFSPFGRPEKYKGPLRLIEKEFSVNYGTGKSIFIENCNDLFAANVPTDFIHLILEHCWKFHENEYVFQSKNPMRFLPFLQAGSLFPPEIILGCTIETNRDVDTLSSAPHPINRFLPMQKLEARKFITIEPIMDFDVYVLASWMDQIRPEFVNIGADSKGNNLPEPPAEKVHALIDKLTEYGIEIREKHNLGRLL